jgi:hypothetical protein
MTTEVKPIRKGSKGLKGTIIRSRHHAKMMLPFIDAMRGAVKHLGFAEWLEGETVHEFRTHDDRRYTLRGLRVDGKYIAIQLAARLSRSNEIPLLTVQSVSEAPSLLTVLSMLAKPLATGEAYEEPEGEAA